MKRHLIAIAVTAVATLAFTAADPAEAARKQKPKAAVACAAAAEDRSPGIS